MTLEQLKALLDSGAITKEQFDAMAKAIDPNYAPDKGEDSDPADEDDDKTDPEDKDTDIEDIIARAVDRATNKLGNENKKLRAQLEKARKANLSDKELRDLELADKEEELAEREKQVKEYENRMYAMKAIRKAGLDKGDELSIDITDFVMADEEETIDTRVKAFKKLVDSLVKAAVDEAFKAGSRTPDKGGKSTGIQNNPYAKETFNLTEQMRLEASEPQKAEILKAQAGMKK